MEKLTGQLLPFSQTVFATFNFVPTIIVLLVMPCVLILLRPRDDEMQVFVPSPEAEAPAVKPIAGPLPFARRVERSRLGSLFLVLAGIGYLWVTWSKSGVSLDANTVIFIS